MTRNVWVMTHPEKVCGPRGAWGWGSLGRGRGAAHTTLYVWAGGRTFAPPGGTALPRALLAGALRMRSHTPHAIARSRVHHPRKSARRKSLFSARERASGCEAGRPSHAAAVRVRRLLDVRRLLPWSLYRQLFAGARRRLRIAAAAANRRRRRRLRLKTSKQRTYGALCIGAR